MATHFGATHTVDARTVVVGGLISSTFLTLILLPVLYEWLETRAERRTQEKST